VKGFIAAHVLVVSQVLGEIRFFFSTSQIESTPSFALRGKLRQFQRS
jgi:hypothetical protein